MPFPHLIISNPKAWKGCPSPSNPGFLTCFQIRQTLQDELRLKCNLPVRVISGDIHAWIYVDLLFLQTKLTPSFLIIYMRKLANILIYAAPPLKVFNYQ